MSVFKPIDSSGLYFDPTHFKSTDYISAPVVAMDCAIIVCILV